MSFLIMNLGMLWKAFISVDYALFFHIDLSEDQLGSFKQNLFITTILTSLEPVCLIDALTYAANKT
jgi:hypothetical protein